MAFNLELVASLLLACDVTEESGISLRLATAEYVLTDGVLPNFTQFVVLILVKTKHQKMILHLTKTILVTQKTMMTFLEPEIAYG